ncbi:hypothetical protein ACHAWX_006182 [Stephanocyclus meneghinianus]
MDENQVPRYLSKAHKNNASGSESTYELSLRTHVGFQACLAQKTVVLIGDSRVRYQFMNLASYLKSKKFMKCEDQVAYDNIDDECLVINEKMNTLGWNHWFVNSTSMISDLHHNQTNTKTESQTCLCDCFRPEVGFAYNHFFENRFIKRITRHGEINLVFLSNFVDTISMNENFPPYSPFYNQPKRCHPGKCGRWGDGDSTDAWRGNLNATLWEVLPRLNATHVFVNLGWDRTFNHESEFSCALNKFATHHPGIKVTYMSHPRGKGAFFDAAALKCSVDVLDRYTLTKNVPRAWYWDELHVLSILNEEFNRQLIEKICPVDFWS